jgi:hypothetical protein
MGQMFHNLIYSWFILRNPSLFSYISNTSKRYPYIFVCTGIITGYPKEYDRILKGYLRISYKDMYGIILDIIWHQETQGLLFAIMTLTVILYTLKPIICYYLFYYFLYCFYIIQTMISYYFKSRFGPLFLWIHFYYFKFFVDISHFYRDYYSYWNTINSIVFI